MSLSAQEKLRVAHRLDELGIDVIEAGFPSSNPKELELFGLLAGESFRHAQVAAFGMTRRRDTRADADPGLRVLADSGAPVCTIVGKTWGLHLEKVVKVDREENLRMISESVAFLVGEGKRVIYDAEHFFDGFADDPAYALRCVRAAAEAGADTVTCCDTNGGTLPHQIAAAISEVVATLGSDGREGRDPLPRRLRLRRGVHARRRRQRSGSSAGDDERLRRALREREPGHDHPQPPVEARLRVRDRGAARLARPGRALLRRDPQLHPGSRPAVRRAQRVRPQGRHARGGCQHRPGDVRAHRPGRGRQPARAADLRAVGEGHGARARPRRRDPRSATARPAGWSSASRSSSTAVITSKPPTGRSSCCSARRPATTSRCSGSSPGARSSRSAPTAASRPKPRSRSGSTASATCGPPRATAR